MMIMPVNKQVPEKLNGYKIATKNFFLVVLDTGITLAVSAAVLGTS